MTYRHKFHTWVWSWPDWLFNHFSQPAFWLLCRIRGHEPIVDHCGLSDHDFCGCCGKSMPGQAPR